MDDALPYKETITNAYGLVIATRNNSLETMA